MRARGWFLLYGGNAGVRAVGSGKGRLIASEVWKLTRGRSVPGGPDAQKEDRLGPERSRFVATKT